MEDLKPKLGNLLVNQSEEKYRSNLLQIEIYYDEFNYYKTEETPAYPVGQLLICYMLGISSTFHIDITRFVHPPPFSDNTGITSEYLLLYLICNNSIIAVP